MVGSHVAERGRENETGSLARKALDGALRVRALRDVLDIGGLDPIAELFFDGAPADVVLIGPAVVADRSDVDEADLQLVRTECGGGGKGERQSGCESEALLH